MKNWLLYSLFFLFSVISCGTCFAQSATSNTPSRQEQPDGKKICPTVSVSCPNDPKLDELMEFTATVAGGDPNLTPIYNWTVSNGVIIEGQGTRVIRVKIDGYVTITGTLELGGLDTICSRTASCSTMIHPLLPPLKKFDSYGQLAAQERNLRLDRFLAALNNSPGAQGYILGYRGSSSPAGAAEKAIAEAREYLISIGLEDGRIVTVDGGLNEEFMVELWVVPTGTVPPSPSAAPAEDGKSSTPEKP